MATLAIPAYGYGLRYEYGIFKQLICNGSQVINKNTVLVYNYVIRLKNLMIGYVLEILGKKLVLSICYLLTFMAKLLKTLTARYIDVREERNNKKKLF